MLHQRSRSLHLLRLFWRHTLHYCLCWLMTFQRHSLQVPKVIWHLTDAELIFVRIRHFKINFLLKENLCLCSGDFPNIRISQIYYCDENSHNRKNFGLRRAYFQLATFTLERALFTNTSTLRTMYEFEVCTIANWHNSQQVGQRFFQFLSASSCFHRFQVCMLHFAVYYNKTINYFRKLLMCSFSSCVKNKNVQNDSNYVVHFKIHVVINKIVWFR